MTTRTWTDAARDASRAKLNDSNELTPRVLAVMPPGEWLTADEITFTLYGDDATPAHWWGVTGALERAMLSFRKLDGKSPVTTGLECWIYRVPINRREDLRAEILAVLCEPRNQREVMDAVAKRLPGTGVLTIRNTLMDMAKSGIVKTTRGWRGFLTYGVNQ